MESKSLQEQVNDLRSTLIELVKLLHTQKTLTLHQTEQLINKVERLIQNDKKTNKPKTKRN